MNIQTIPRTKGNPIIIDTVTRKSSNKSKLGNPASGRQEFQISQLPSLILSQQRTRQQQLAQIKAKLARDILLQQNQAQLGASHQHLLFQSKPFQIMQALQSKNVDQSGSTSTSTMASIRAVRPGRQLLAVHRPVIGGSTSQNFQWAGGNTTFVDNDFSLIQEKPAMDKKLQAWKNLEDLIIGLKPAAEQSSISPQSASKVPVGKSALEASLTLQGAFESDSLPHSDKTRVLPFMVSLRDDGSSEAQVNTKVDIVCVLDISGSMEGEKMENMKSTMKLLLKLLTGHRLAIVLFGTSAEVWMNFKTVNATSIPKIIEVIDHIDSSGSTNITAGVYLAQSLMGSRRTKNQVSSVFLLSDGDHTDGVISEEILFGGDLQRAKTDYTLHTFGYGDDHDARFLQSLAEHKGGNYYFIQDITKVDECFLDCLGMVTTVLAKQCTISINLAPSALYPEIRISNTYGTYVKQLSETSAVISVPPIYAGMGKDYLFEIEFEATNKQLTSVQLMEVIRLKLECQEIGTSSPLKRTQFVTLKALPVGSDKPVSKNLEVKKNFMRVKFADALDKVEQLKSRGDPIRALKLLKKIDEAFQREDELKADPLMVSLKAQLDQITKMVDNDSRGKQNEYKTENFVTQQRNVYMNQQSAPQFGQEMYSSVTQSRNTTIARSLK